jgi:hypothetical protein
MLWVSPHPSVHTAAISAASLRSFSCFTRDFSEEFKMRFSRRIFLYLSGLSFLSYFSIKFGSKVKQLLSRPKCKTVNAQIFGNPYKSREKALVSMVGGQNVRKMVEEAVTLIGGFEKIRVENKTILVKPNAVTGEPNPTTTNPEVLRAVVEFLYEEGAKKVVVGATDPFDRQKYEKDGSDQSCS